LDIIDAIPHLYTQWTDLRMNGVEDVGGFLKKHQDATRQILSPRLYDFRVIGLYGKFEHLASNQEFGSPLLL